MYFAVAGEAWMMVRESMRTVRILRERRCSASLAFSRRRAARERCSTVSSGEIVMSDVSFVKFFSKFFGQEEIVSAVAGGVALDEDLGVPLAVGERLLVIGD